MSLPQSAMLSLDADNEPEKTTETVLSAETEFHETQAEIQPTPSEIGAKMLDPFLDGGTTTAAELEGKTVEAGEKKAEDFTAYIRTLLTQPHEIQSTTEESEVEGDIPEVTQFQPPVPKPRPTVRLVYTFCLLY